jgi:hypothetical protein
MRMSENNTVVSRRNQGPGIGSGKPQKLV